MCSLSKESHENVRFSSSMTQRARIRDGGGRPHREPPRRPSADGRPSPPLGPQPSGCRWRSRPRRWRRRVRRRQPRSRSRSRPMSRSRPRRRRRRRRRRQPRPRYRSQSRRTLRRRRRPIDEVAIRRWQLAQGDDAEVDERVDHDRRDQRPGGEREPGEEPTRCARREDAPTALVQVAEAEHGADDHDDQEVARAGGEPAHVGDPAPPEHHLLADPGRDGHPHEGRPLVPADREQRSEVAELALDESHDPGIAAAQLSPRQSATGSLR